MAEERIESRATSPQDLEWMPVENQRLRLLLKEALREIEELKRRISHDDGNTDERRG